MEVSKVMRKLALFGMSAGFTGVLCAQEVPRFTVAGGAGFTTPVGTTSSNLDTGWNIRGGAGVNFSQYLAAMLEAGYDSMAVGSGVLNSLGSRAGRLILFSLPLTP